MEKENCDEIDGLSGKLVKIAMLKLGWEFW